MSSMIVATRNFSHCFIIFKIKQCNLVKIYSKNKGKIIFMHRTVFIFIWYFSTLLFRNSCFILREETTLLTRLIISGAKKKKKKNYDKNWLSEDWQKQNLRISIEFKFWGEKKHHINDWKVESKQNSCFDVEGKNVNFLSNYRKTIRLL